jgi:deoxyribonuclease-4
MAPRAGRPPVGAHVPVGGGLARISLPHADRVGAEAVQVFVSNPRGWQPTAGDPGQDASFRAGCEARGMPVFIHAPYLINFGSPTPQTVLNSVRSLAHSLQRGVQIGAAGVVVHAGSAVSGDGDAAALRRVRESLLPLLDGIPADGPRVLIEPTAGAGRALAARMSDLAGYFAVLDAHPALGVCLDTCHAFAAGHDVTRRGGVRDLVADLDAAVGLDRLGLVHANDSLMPAGSHRDRHESVGRGLIGITPFRQLLRHPGLRRVPFVVETNDSDQADDIATLKALRGKTIQPLPRRAD